jgi:shikimate kinase
LLAERLGRPFVDSDDRLAAAVGMPAGQWLAQVGEVEFRRAEAELLVDLLASRQPAVLATGGGAVTSGTVRSALAAPWLCVVWLRATVPVLAARLRASTIARPPLTGLPLADEITQVALAREPLYAGVASLQVDTTQKTLEATVTELLRFARP